MGRIALILAIPALLAGCMNPEPTEVYVDRPTVFIPDEKFLTCPDLKAPPIGTDSEKEASKWAQGEIASGDICRENLKTTVEALRLEKLRIEGSAAQ